MLTFYPPFQTYTAYISQYDSETDTWEPYSGVKDMQFEFTMLDPHIRTALKPLAGVPGAYQLTFRAPDRHGVFKFVIDYKRKGWVLRPLFLIRIFFLLSYSLFLLLMSTMMLMIL